MSSRRTHIVIPEGLATEIDRLIGRRGRSRFLVEAAERELRRRRLLAALDKAAGAWRDEDHPELKAGSARWVRRLRQREEALRQRKVRSRR